MREPRLAINLTAEGSVLRHNEPLVLPVYVSGTQSNEYLPS